MALDEVRKQLDATMDLLVEWLQYIRDPRGNPVRLLAVPERSSRG